MTRLSRTRLAMTAAVALGTGVAGLALAPDALAETGLAALKAPATVVAGTPFTVSGTDCVTIPGNFPLDTFTPTAWAVVDTGKDDTDIVEVDPAQDGTWSLQLTFPSGTTGEHEVHASCGNGYHGDPDDYPVLEVTVTAPSSGGATSSSTPTPVATSREFVRGATPNTPGVATVTTAGTTGSTAPAGTKVVKIIKGFQPHEVVTLVLHSTPVALGTFTADANGVLTVEFTLPAGTPEGDHTLAYDGNLGSHFEDPITVRTATAATTGAASSGLAYTGADVALPLGLGSAMLLVGGGVLVVTRRRRTGAPQT